MHQQMKSIEYNIGWLTCILYPFPKFSRFCLLGYKHKLPSTVRISPRTIGGKDTKILELQGFLKDFYLIFTDLASPNAKHFFAMQSQNLDSFVPRSDAKRGKKSTKTPFYLRIVKDFGISIPAHCQDKPPVDCFSSTFFRMMLFFFAFLHLNNSVTTN